MADFLDALLGFLSGVFGILLGLAYFLPVVLIVVAIAVYAYLRSRKGRPTVFSAQEPSKGRRKRRD